MNKITAPSGAVIFCNPSDDSAGLMRKQHKATRKNHIIAEKSKKNCGFLLTNVWFDSIMQGEI